MKLFQAIYYCRQGTLTRLFALYVTLCANCGEAWSIHYDNYFSAASHRQTQTIQAEEERIIAALLWNFLLFIEFPTEQETLVVGFVGNNRVENFLAEIARQKKLANGKSVEVRRITNIDDIVRCHAVYVAPSENVRMQQILNKTRGRGILTIGRDNDFLLRGGMMNFYIENSKVRFEYNNEELTGSKLRCSSQLLRHGRQYSKSKE